jgi:hypothetical protein
MFASFPFFYTIIMELNGEFGVRFELLISCCTAITVPGCYLASALRKRVWFQLGYFLVEEFLTSDCL